MPYPFPSLPADMAYVGILFGLFVVPRALQRFGVPAAITSLLLGAIVGLGFGVLQHDETIHLLSSFGITALFLFAGLEVDTSELRANAGILTQHLVVRLILLAACAFGLVQVLHLEPRMATLLALALLTPSTGFILDSLGLFGLEDGEKRWVKSKAIAAELLALLVMFATLQSTSLEKFLVSFAVLTVLIALLPLVFRAFAAFVVPHAPRSEFAFLLMIALVCAIVTRELGVYYLVGAFVVGMAAQRFRERLPALASEQMVHAVEMFSSFFVPFYFFNAGLRLQREDLHPMALAYGAVFFAVVVPVRLGAVLLHRRFALGEGHAEGMRIAVSLLPTLVFGLALAEILRDRFAAPPELFGGVVLYTLATTLVPAFFFRRPYPDLTEPHAPELSVAGDGGEAADDGA